MLTSVLPLLQGIFNDYKQPFAVTYLGASLMVVYLPIAFIKDWLCKFLKNHYSKSGKNADSSSPLKYNGGQKTFEMESILTRKDSEADLSPHLEETPLVPRSKEGVNILKHEKEVTTREIVKYGFYIAPIWFITEVKVLSTFMRLLLLDCFQYHTFVIFTAIHYLPTIMFLAKISHLNSLSSFDFWYIE